MYKRSRATGLPKSVGHVTALSPRYGRKSFFRGAKSNFGVHSMHTASGSTHKLVRTRMKQGRLRSSSHPRPRPAVDQGWQLTPSISTWRRLLRGGNSGQSWPCRTQKATSSRAGVHADKIFIATPTHSRPIVRTCSAFSSLDLDEEEALKPALSWYLRSSAFSYSTMCEGGRLQRSSDRCSSELSRECCSKTFRHVGLMSQAP